MINATPMGGGSAPGATMVMKASETAALALSRTGFPLWPTQGIRALKDESPGFAPYEDRTPPSTAHEETRGAEQGPTIRREKQQKGKAKERETA